MFRHLSFLALVVLTCLVLIGCKGERGPAGPAGSPGGLETGNNSLKFLGGNGYVEIPYSPVLKSAAFTVELWVYLDTLYAPFIPLIGASYINQHNTADGYGMKFEAGKLYFTVATAYNLGAAYWATYTPPTKQWVHLAGTFDGSYARVFINGQQVAEFDSVAPAYNGSQGLWIGTGYHSDYGGYSFFHGMMDEIRIWDHARTATEIQQTKDTKLAGTEQGLIGYWNFDNIAQGYLVIDGSKYHNHGAIWGDTYLTPTEPF